MTDAAPVIVVVPWLLKVLATCKVHLRDDSALTNVPLWKSNNIDSNDIMQIAIESA